MNNMLNIWATKKKHPVSDWQKKKDHPVVNVSWMMPLFYCKWFNETYQGELKKQAI